MEHNLGEGKSGSRDIYMLACGAPHKWGSQLRPGSWEGKLREVATFSFYFQSEPGGFPNGSDARVRKWGKEIKKELGFW